MYLTIRAIHLVECVWYDRVDRVLLMQYFPESVGTVEQGLEESPFALTLIADKMWEPSG
jgi:hypothetical protein